MGLGGPRLLTHSLEAGHLTGSTVLSPWWKHSHHGPAWCHGPAIGLAELVQASSATTRFNLYPCETQLLLSLLSSSLFIHAFSQKERPSSEMTAVVLPLRLDATVKTTSKIPMWLCICFRPSKATPQFDLHCRSFCVCKRKMSLTIG